MPSARETLLPALRTPKALSLILGILLAVAAVGAFFYFHGRSVMQEQLRGKLSAVAAVASSQIRAEDVQRVRSARDSDQPEYRRLLAQLESMRRSVPGVRYAYVLRRTGSPTQLEFVADADAGLDAAALDENGNGAVDSDEEPAYPGDLYDVSSLPALREDAWSGPAADPAVGYDQWGATISGYAPIRDQDGRAVAVVGVDMDAAEFLRQSHRVFSPIGFLLLLFAGLLLSLSAVMFLAQRRLETLSELEKQRTLLMQLTTHQLGAPLATFKWWMEIFHDSQDAKAQEERLDVHMLEEGITRMDAIMKSLQEAYQVFSGEVAYTPMDASLEEIIRRTAKETEELRTKRRITLTLSLENHLPTMKLDPKLVAAVLRELMDNAITYSPSGAAITVRARPTLTGVEVQVQDGGQGIPAKNLPRIFERFSRGSNAMQMKPVGNGLGLFTARGIIRRAGGDMWIESQEGKGTVVTFTLPVGK